MAGGYGLSRMMQGAVEGIDKVQQRRDQNVQRERSKTQWQQGQSDREHQLTRQGVTEGRQDADYQRKEDSRERNDAVNRAMNAAMNGDLVPANEVFNKYSEDDISFDLQPNEKGTYTSIMSYKDKKSDPKDVTIDDIGKTLIGFKNDDNPFVRRAAEQKLERDTEAKKGERKHDMAKLEKEYELKRGVEHVKGSYKDGKSGAAASKTRQAISKEHNDIAVQDYGSLFGDQWGFNKTQDKTMRSAQANLADSYYFSSDDPNITTNSSGYSAFKDMQKFLSLAEQKVNAEIDEGVIDKKDKENRVVQYIDSQVDNQIKSMAPTPGESLQRGGGEPEYKTNNNTPVPLEAIQLLKSDSSDEAKKEFDDHFNSPGLADKILGGGELGEGKTAEAGVSGEGSPSLIREANAGEAQPAAKTEEKPKLSRKRPDGSGQKDRKETKKSQKAHRQIAVSEYKNEWTSMDDAEKTEWFAENAQALKAASPRSHKKANKEITAIRRKERFSKKGKQEYNLMREERKK